MTREKQPSRHRRPGRPVEGIPGRGMVAYFGVLAGSGASAVSYVVAHDEAWWWAKALASAGVFAAVAALGLWLRWSFLVSIWAVVAAEWNGDSAPAPGPGS